MKYENTLRGRFISRPNRFVALVDIGGAEERCHVKNTGRLGELLLPGAEVVVQRAAKDGRRTAFDLIAVVKDGFFVNIDSQAPNKLFAEWVAAGKSPFDIDSSGECVRREYVYGKSRFDFMIADVNGQKHLVETKGVTLLENGVALFPDAPTERGVKHLRHLVSALREGYKCWCVFIVKDGRALSFAANGQNHPEFEQVLRQAADCGVRILALRCAVSGDEIAISEEIPANV